jgi:hypothetical protein
MLENSVYTGIAASTIKSATLEILKHPFPTPIPARRFLQPVLILIGQAEKDEELFGDKA